MKKITIFLFSMLLFISCDDPNKDNMAPTLDKLPISSWLAENPEEFSEWVALLKYTDMYNTMNLNTKYTAFVPTNEAMDAYLAAKGYSSVESMSKEDAVLLIKYHTIEGKAYTQNQFGNGMLPDTTATGDFLTINFRDTKILVNNEAPIKRVDVDVTNGVLHTLDAVLNPITATVWEEINVPEFSIMAKAIEMTGYNEMLNKIREEKRKFQYTLFAVPDSIYQKNGINSIEDLIDELEVSDPLYTSEGNELNLYVAYHIFDQQLDFLQLATFSSEDMTKNIAPIAPYQLINISVQSPFLYVNYDKETETGISIIENDINTKNGLMHVVNDPMFLFVPERASVIWELTDYPALSGIVKNYRNKGLRTTEESNITTDQKIDFYTWETSLPDYMDFSVRYIAYSENDYRHKFVNYDALSLSLRSYGWIEMESPIIVKGEYTMRIRHNCPLQSGRTGSISIAIDGMVTGSSVLLNGGEDIAKIKVTTVGTVTFDETSSHTLRIMQGDNSTVVIDCIEFIPT